MRTIKKIGLAALALFAFMMAANMPAAAQPQQRPPNILVAGSTSAPTTKA
jgi:hypothetical protein